VNKDNVIVGIGYNGFPRGCSDSDLPWAKKSKQGNALQTKYPYVSGELRLGDSTGACQHALPAQLPGPHMHVHGAARHGAGVTSKCTPYPLGGRLPRTAHAQVVHAEANALLNKNAAHVEGAVSCLAGRALLRAPRLRARASSWAGGRLPGCCDAARVGAAAGPSTSGGGCADQPGRLPAAAHLRDHDAVQRVCQASDPGWHH
jgi:deoxycytidylate deaminase